MAMVCFHSSGLRKFKKISMELIDSHAPRPRTPQGIQLLQLKVLLMPPYVPFRTLVKVPLFSK